MYPKESKAMNAIEAHKVEARKTRYRTLEHFSAAYTRNFAMLVLRT